MQITRPKNACCAEAAGDTEILVFLDADWSDDPAEIPTVLRPVLDGRADLVLGPRLAGLAEDGALTLGEPAGHVLLRWLYGLELTDVGPFRMIRADVFRALGMNHRTYGWPVEMVVKAAKKGYRVVEEVPVSCRRRTGQSKVAGTITGSLLAGYHLLLATALRYALRG